ncbi:MAG: hypothetical protein ACO3F2_01290 [Roseiflexaceae bacterium]
MVAPLFFGSLPHTNIEEAWQFLRECPAPWVSWPQLPQRSFWERSVVQSSYGFPGVVVDEKQRLVVVHRRESDAQLTRLALDYLERRPHQIPLRLREAEGLLTFETFAKELAPERGIKGQILGPISLAAQLNDETQTPIINDATLFEGLVIHLIQRVRWQVAQLQAIQRPVLMCIEEPFLDVMNSPFMEIDRDDMVWALSRILSVIPAPHVKRGLIVGATRQIGDLIQLPVDVFVVNICESMGVGALLNAILPLQQFFTRKGVLGLGCVAVSDAVDDVAIVMRSLIPIVEQLIQSGIDAHVLANQLMVMPVTSFGQTNVANATQAMNVTCQVADKLRHYFEQRV